MMMRVGTSWGQMSCRHLDKLKEKSYSILMVVNKLVKTFFGGVEDEPRTLCMIGKCSIIGLHPQP
jgi:hypothetical protein